MLRTAAKINLKTAVTLVSNDRILKLPFIYQPNYPAEYEQKMILSKYPLADPPIKAGHEVHSDFQYKMV